MIEPNDFVTLAEAYAVLGYSVIPLLGDHDPSRPKVPAVPWAGFQRNHASLEDRTYWFIKAGFTAIGIVTGSVSNLVVLDFDSEAAFKDFRKRYPDLAETHTVQSAGRGLPHLYFRLPSHLHIESLKGQGVDLLSDGRYVVAPPTCINGQPYKITRGGTPKTLTERDIRRIQAFLASHKASEPPTLINAEKQPSEHTALSAAPASKPTCNDLKRLYEYQCQRGSRNEALFLTSLYARDTGWTQAEVQTVLVSLHTRQQPSGKHARETPKQRQREAVATIRSAFSRPPRAHRSPPPSEYLCNSVREALFQNKMTYAVRTIEGLLQAGKHPGQWITASETIALLKGDVGRDSVLKALNSKYADSALFGPPVSPPNTANAVAHSHTETQSKNCFLIGGKNQEKIGRGRPAKRYRIPTTKKLCRILGVKATASDALEPDDLRSARQTRIALHREFIKRRPDRYCKRWLADRLGVSIRTIYNYMQLAGVHSRAEYFETRIYWDNITQLPLGEPLQGAFLRDKDGKKYPARREIASRWLAKGCLLWLMRQTANYYWWGDMEPPPWEWRKPAEQPAEKSVAPPSVPVKQISLPVLSPVMRSAAPTAGPTPEAKTAYDHDLFKISSSREEDEWRAMHLYEALNQIQGPESRKLSRATARQLVAKYSKSELRRALECLRSRSKTTIIRNPAGFLVTFLRSQARARSMSP